MQVYYKKVKKTAYPHDSPPFDYDVETYCFELENESIKIEEEFITLITNKKIFSTFENNRFESGVEIIEATDLIFDENLRNEIIIFVTESLERLKKNSLICFTFKEYKIPATKRYKTFRFLLKVLNNLENFK